MILRELFARLGLEVDEAGFEVGEKAMEGLKHGAEAIGAALAAAAVALGAVAGETAKTAKEIEEGSVRTGIATDELQKLAYATSFYGVNLEELSHGLLVFERNASEAHRGNVEMARGFERAGISFGELTSLSPEKKILKIAEAFKTTVPQAQKADIAMEVFGRQLGPRLIPLLNKGRAGVHDLMEELETMGGVMSEETIKAGVEFDDNLKRIKASSLGLMYAIGGPVLKVLNRLIDAYRKFKKDIQENAPWVQKTTVLLKGLGFVIGGALLTALLLNLGTVTGLIAEYGVLAAESIAAAVASAGAWLAAAAPIILLGALLTLVLLAAEDVYQFFTGGKSLLGEFGPKLTEFLDNWAKPRGDEWWITKQIKEAYGWLLRIYEPIGKLVDKWNESGGWQAVKSFWSGGTPGFQGGAASPGAAASAAGGAGPSPFVMAPKMELHQSIVASPGMSAADVAAKTTEAQEAWWNGKMSGALLGTQ